MAIEKRYDHKIYRGFIISVFSALPSLRFVSRTANNIIMVLLKSGLYNENKQKMKMTVDNYCICVCMCPVAKWEECILVPKADRYLAVQRRVAEEEKME